MPRPFDRIAIKGRTSPRLYRKNSNFRSYFIFVLASAMDFSRQSVGTEIAGRRAAMALDFEENESAALVMNNFCHVGRGN